MSVVAWIKAVCEAIVALPKIMEELRIAVTNIKLEVINNDYNEKIKDLEKKINDLSKAKTNAEIASSIAALNKRS